MFVSFGILYLPCLSRSIYALHQELSIDKTPIPFQGRLGFKWMHHQNGEVCNVVVIFSSHVNLEGTRTYELSC